MVHPDGYVEIRDRIKDVIISGGENISSVEVEGRCCHPAVQEAAMDRRTSGGDPAGFRRAADGQTATEDEIIALPGSGWLTRPHAG